VLSFDGRDEGAENKGNSCHGVKEPFIPQLPYTTYLIYAYAICPE
jgi:hypothetical protein